MAILKKSVQKSNSWTPFLTSTDVNSLHPSTGAFIYQDSCLNGYAEDTNNLGYSLLRRGVAITTVASSRVSWYLIGTWNHTTYWPVFADNTGIGFNYVYNLLLGNMSASKALFLSKYEGGDGTQSESWMNKFDFNLYGDPQLKYWTSQAPNVPSSPSPSDNEEGIDSSVALSVLVSDPDSNNLTVSFYNASNNNLIDVVSDVRSGERVSVTWNGLVKGENYSWYAVVTDGQRVTISPTWHFCTYSSLTAPTNPQPANDTTGLALTLSLSVVVIDDTGSGLDVLFYNGLNDSLIGSVNKVYNGSIASITWSGLKEGTLYKWYVVATDGVSSVRSSILQFVTDYAPSALDPLPSPDSDDVSINPTLSLEVIDKEGSSINISFYKADDNSLLGTVINKENGSTASVTLHNLIEGHNYTWYASLSDGILSHNTSIFDFITITTNPQWEQYPQDQTVDYGTRFVYDVNASDISGVTDYLVNDTTNFSVDNTGLITNSTILTPGKYGLLITAFDPYNNNCTAIITVTVLNKQLFPYFPAMSPILVYLIAGGLIVAVTIVVFIIFIKKRRY